jgi:AcrR family transcriptional regulator
VTDVTDLPGVADLAVALPRRRRNPRGQGHRLRDEILAGATAILERTGSEEAVTLRAIAREIGISAPSISDHFADRATIIDAVVAERLAELAAQLTAAACAADDPVEALTAAWAAYVEFGRAYPTQYRVIFERRYLSLWDDEQRPMSETAPVYNDTVTMMIGLLQTCIDSGRSTSTDALEDSVAIWYYAHGLVALPLAITSFPWPDRRHHLTSGVTSLGHLNAAPDA